MSQPLSKEEFERIVRRLDAKVSEISIAIHKLTDQPLERTPKKETWVKVGVIQQLTGWNKAELRRARENKLVKMKTTKTGIYYLLESLNELFIVKEKKAAEGFGSK